MQPGGQSIVDRLLAAKNTIVAQPMAKVVCKATTEEMTGPKRKHLDCLLQATHEMNISIPELADLLIERSQNSSWIVSFKSLITIHHLMSHGNERFEAYMASHNHHLQATIYVHQIGMAGSDMTVYLRQYATYLYEKREAYKLLGYDFCKIKLGRVDGFLRSMPTDKLLKALPILQKQLEALLQFDIAPNELINGVINSCFFLLIQDLIRLYGAYDDGMITLLEKYFDVNKKQCREIFELYKKFIERTDKIGQYLKIAESAGMERTEISDVTRPSTSLLETLETHLIQIEGKRLSSQISGLKHPTEHEIKIFPRNFAINIKADPRKVLEEEEATALARFNQKKETSSSSSPVPPPTATTTNGNGNGFSDTDFFSQHSSSNGHHHHHQQQQQLFSDDLFSLAPSSSSTVTNIFPAFDNMPGTSTSKQNFFDDLLQPIPTSTTKSTSTMPLFPNNQNIPPLTKPLQSGDLNSSLNQLIDNLGIKDHSKIGKDHQWTPSDGRGQQILGTITGTMNTSGTTWPNATGMSAPFSGATGIMWPQPPPPVSSTTNPFAASNNSSQLNFTGLSDPPTNPFAAQPSYGASVFHPQPQVNDPFGSL